MREPSLTIAADATYSIGRNLTGVGVYSRELLNGLCASHPDDRFLFCYRPHRFLRSFSETLPANASRSLLGAGYRRRADLFHALNQRVDGVNTRRVVATFHDLFVISGDYSSMEFRARFTEQARGAAERADLIIAVSEFTASQVVGALGVERERVRVVHHGVRPPGDPPPADESRENLILHVGAVQKRKNIARLVEAFERTPAGWKLLLAGGDGFGAAEIMSRIAASPRSADIEMAGYVSEVRLERMYRRARIFAFPSLDEGFGMPVLDAMARGVPVVTSNRSATREVAGGAALLVDPFDTDSIASGITRVAGNAALRDQLRRAGLEHARTFSWDRAVAETWAVYRELV